MRDGFDIRRYEDIYPPQQSSLGLACNRYPSARMPRSGDKDDELWTPDQGS